MYYIIQVLHPYLFLRTTNVFGSYHVVPTRNKPNVLDHLDWNIPSIDNSIISIHFILFGTLPSHTSDFVFPRQESQHLEIFLNDVYNGN